MTDAPRLAAFDEARDWIAEGDATSALDMLLPLLSGLAQDGGRKWQDLRNEIILHARGAASDRRQARRGLATREQASVAQTRTAFALLELIDEVERKLRRATQAVPSQAPLLEPLHMGAVEGHPEKIIGRDNLKSIAWLAKGLEASRAVCRIQAGRVSGTGFHIGGGRIVTNNHVVPDAATAAVSRVEFNFQRGPDGRMEQSVLLPVHPDGFATAPKPLDCSVICVPAADGAFPAVALGNGPPPAIGDPVSIIQHPMGGEKQIAVTSNEVVALAGSRLVYMTDTLAGSSGAPVFDEAWQVVALHRAGGGTVLLPDGRRMRGNEGVLIAALLSDSSVSPELKAGALTQVVHPG
jgi:S1-C subfamily serine protease